jgi:hypothetical protein
MKDSFLRQVLGKRIPESLGAEQSNRAFCKSKKYEIASSSHPGVRLRRTRNDSFAGFFRKVLVRISREYGRRVPMGEQKNVAVGAETGTKIPRGSGDAAPKGRIARRFGALAIGAQAVGVFSLGAFAIGALSLGVFAIGRLAVGRARIKRLEIDELLVNNLSVRKLRVQETLQAPGQNPLTGPSAGR